MNRLLGQTEHLMWLIDQYVPLNASVCASISGTFTIQQLSEALNKVQQRNPLLTVRIGINDKKEPMFYTDNVPKIPLIIRERKTENDWCLVIEEELVKSFPWREGPLIRVVLLQSNDTSEIIFTFHHSIGDGLSVVYLIEDVLYNLANVSINLKQSTMSTSYEELIPNSSSELNENFLEETANKTANKYKIADSNLFRKFNNDTSSKNWQVGLYHWELSPLETDSLLSRCRNEGTTVHGALCASFLSAIANEFVLEDEAFLKCFSPINLRNYLRHSVGRNFGLYTALVLTCHQIKSLSNYWETAREAKHQIKQAVVEGQIFDNVIGLERFLASKPDSIEVRQYLRNHAPSDIFVSNLGQLNISYQFGTLNLQAIHLSGSGLTIEPFFVGVATLKGKMYITFRYVKSTISQDCAYRIGRQAMQTLRHTKA